VDAGFASLGQQLSQARYGTVPDDGHVSEVTSWLRPRQFHVHVGRVDPVGFTAGY